MRRLIAALVLSAALLTRLAAQAPGNPGAQFASRVQMVEVYVSVTDGARGPVTGLRQGDFEVYEDGQLEPTTVFAAGEFPLSVAIGVDRSWSMNGEPLRLSRLAAQSFLRALKPSDRAMVVAISSEADVIAPLSVDRDAQIRAVGALDPWSTTALYDAIIASLGRLTSERGRQALVVFSDGVDRYSTANAAQVIDRARHSGALVYPIAFGKTGSPVLGQLAEITGGRSFLLKDARELDATLTSIARELRHQYLLGYTPARPFRPGEHEWRSIRVALRGNHSGVHVRAREGYVAD